MPVKKMHSLGFLKIYRLCNRRIGTSFQARAINLFTPEHRASFLVDIKILLATFILLATEF